MALQANSEGVLTGKFTIPANVPTGTKLVEFVGQGGTRARATFTGQGTITTTTLRTEKTIITQFYDPLAQTFTLQNTVQIVAIDLWFTAKGTTDILVQIRETSNGVPTRNVLGERRLKPAQITSLTGGTHIDFPAPITLQAGVEYAVVILCDDAVSALAVAELGKFDSNSQKWVTSQPYQIGVLLSSSNASTWTAHQDKDLAFALHRAAYAETNKTVDLGTVAVADATDLMVLTTEELPSSVTRVDYELVLPSGASITVGDSQPVRLDTAVTGNVTVRAKLYGDATFSPVLFPGTQLVVGKVGTSGTYVSRAIAGGSNVRVKVIFDAIIPGGSSVVVSYKGVDAGDTWTTVPFVGSSQIDDGFYEITHQITGVNETMVQVKLELTGTSAARPRVRNLRFMTI